MWRFYLWRSHRRRLAEARAADWALAQLGSLPAFLRRDLGIAGGEGVFAHPSILTRNLPLHPTF